jgi:quercetin dioxygenase-like cupin family protein
MDSHFKKIEYRNNPIPKIEKFKITDQWQVFNKKGSKLKGVLDVGDDKGTVIVYKGVKDEEFEWHYHEFSETVTALGDVVYYLGLETEIEKGQFQIEITKKVLLKGGDSLKIPKGTIHKVKFLGDEGIVLVFCPSLLKDEWEASYLQIESKIDEVYDNLEIMVHDFALKEQLVTEKFFNPSTLNCILTSEGHFKYYSPRWLHEIGLTEKEFESTPITKLMSPEDIDNSLKNGEIVINKYKNFKTNKEFYVKWMNASSNINNKYWLYESCISSKDDYESYIINIK